MSYIKEAQDRVYKKFIREFGHKKVAQCDLPMFEQIRQRRMTMRESLFGSTSMTWYYETEGGTGVL